MKRALWNILTDTLTGVAFGLMVGFMLYPDDAVGWTVPLVVSSACAFFGFLHGLLNALDEWWG